MSAETKRDAFFEVKACRVASVVVYTDRADVCREVTVELTEGSNDVILKNLSKYIDKDSIRVEGRGAASIVDVVYSETQIADQNAEATEQKLAESRKKRTNLLEKKEALKKEDRRCEMQRAVINGLARKIKEPLCDEHGKEGVNPLSQASLDGLESFLNLYARRASELDEKQSSIKKELSDLDSELAALNTTRQQYGELLDDPYNRQLSVAPNATEAGKAVLFVSYLVSRASWLPKYDMRVSSRDVRLKILYYGMIQQSTGEDWNDAQVSLSTATPSVGGEIPQLGTKKVSFKKEVEAVGRSLSRSGIGFPKKSLALPVGASFSADDSVELLALPSQALRFGMRVSQTKVTSGVLSATFDIPLSATVPSDGTNYKVTVAVIDLKPTFEHVTIPKMAARVFMKARVKNDSSYVLVAGPTSIFLDDNFVAKARINNVSPSEEFDCSLGVDNAVRVTYKPQRKFHEQTGVFTKNSCITYVQEVEVKNTREKAVHITVEENLPLSTDDKIKINIIEPQDLKEPPAKDAAVAPVSLNKQNNVVWRVKIPAGETHNFVLSYSIEHPKGEAIEFTEEAAPVLH